MSGSGKFVWVRGLRGPVPEKWPADMPVNSHAGKIVLAAHELPPAEFALKIATLEQRYPAPSDGAQ